MAFTTHMCCLKTTTGCTLWTKMATRKVGAALYLMMVQKVEPTIIPNLKVSQLKNLNMPKFKAQVRFTFEGTVNVTADSREESKRFLQDDFGMTIGNIHTTSDDEISDWEFPVHPDKTIVNIVKA